MREIQVFEAIDFVVHDQTVSLSKGTNEVSVSACIIIKFLHDIIMVYFRFIKR